MVRIRHGWLVAALALGVGVAACKKDEKKTVAPATGDQKVAEKPAEKPAPGGKPLAMPANPNADDLSLLPVDSEVVMGLNFAQLQKSSLWKKFVEPQMMKSTFPKKLGEFKDRCGFDPFAAVQSVSIGMKGVGKSSPDGVVVIHGPDKAKVSACIEKMKPEVAKDGGEVKEEGGIWTFSSKDGGKFAMTYINDTTMLGVVGPNATPAGVKAAAAGGSALKTSAAFVDMYGKINTGDSLWMLMNGNSPAFDQAAQFGFKPKAVFGSVNVTDGLTLDMRVRLDTPDQASQIANMAKGQVAQFAKMVDKLDIANEAADVKVSVALSTQKLESLVAQFAGMMGGMAGGMGGP